MNDELPNRIVVIYHSADFDGLFCREIARTFLPKRTELIGWDFGDPPLKFPKEATVYVLDLSPDVFDKEAALIDNTRLIWIDHHKTSIAKWSAQIPGYRIDGVAACRLVWQWFLHEHFYVSKTHAGLPTKEEFVERIVNEPLAVRLAGEYDVFDKRDPDAELFQHGLKSEELFSTQWDNMLSQNGGSTVIRLLNQGRALKFARANEYKEVIESQGFDLEFDGLKFLACNSHELDIRSQLFEAGIKPHHEGLLGFTFTGKEWRVSLYGVPNRPDTDLSQIAVKYGGGGHAQACGFRISVLPFELPR